MGRYVIHLKNGSNLEADDARYAGGGNFVEYITRYDNYQCSIPSDQIAEIRHANLGWQGGQRFNGIHDRSFRKSLGSI